MTRDPKKPRILAVDDTPANLVALEAVLGRDNELVLVRSGEEAISSLEKDPAIDVILMDIRMPDMSGYEAARRIKKMPSCADIPLIFITAIHTQDPDVRRGYEVGAVDFFTKPFDPHLLKLKVDVYTTFSQRARMMQIRERQLRESQQVLRIGRRYASTLEGLPVGVIVVDSQGSVRMANDEASRVLRSWERHQAAFEPGQSPLARVLSTGVAARNAVTRIECIDGTTKDLMESTSPLRDLDGTVEGAVIVLRDVTEHREFEAALEACIAHLVLVGVELEQTTGSTRPPPGAAAR